MAELELRSANVGDAERLLEIYAPYVKKTAITFEDKVPSIGEFQDRIRRMIKKYPYFVALKDGKIVGYACASPFNANFPGFYNSMSKKPTITAFFEV